MSVPQKHHYVPKFLLNRFADNNKKLFVYRIDSDEHARLEPVKKTAQTLDGHTLYLPGRPPDPSSLEVGMSSIETATGNVVASLLKSKSRSPSIEEQEVLGFFIALQWVRSRFHIEILERSVGNPHASSAQWQRTPGPLHVLTSLLFPWFARRNGDTKPDEVFCQIPDWLQSGPWSWRLYRPNGPKLVVGDNVVCMWGIANDSEGSMPESWSYHGVGVGFNTCARVTVPLAPNLGLVIHREDRRDLRRITAFDFNRATVFNSREFVACHPAGLPSSELRQSLLHDLWIQRQVLPIIYEATRSAADQEAKNAAEQRRQFDDGAPFS